MATAAEAGTSPSVVFVCTGNICRSVMAERVLRHRLAEDGIDDVLVDSGGISDEEAGNPVDPRAVHVLDRKSVV